MSNSSTSFSLSVLALVISFGANAGNLQFARENAQAAEDLKEQAQQIEIMDREVALKNSSPSIHEMDYEPSEEDVIDAEAALKNSVPSIHDEVR